MTFFPTSPQDGDEDLSATNGKIDASGSLRCQQSPVAVWAFISQSDTPYLSTQTTLSTSGLTQSGALTSGPNDSFAYAVGNIPGVATNGSWNFLRLYAVDSSLVIVERGFFAFTAQPG